MALVEAPVQQRTTIPVRAPAWAPPQKRRRLGGFGRGDAANLAGAAAVAFSVSFLLFGHLAPFSGFVAYVIVTWFVFAATYSALSRWSDGRDAAKDKAISVTLASAAVLMLLPLAGITIYAFWGARNALVHLNFYDKSLPGPLAPLTQGGIFHAIVGTLWMIGIATAITVPLGLACAVYLSEVGGRLAKVVRTIVEAMTAFPSVMAGLFIFASLVLTFRERSGLFAAIALAVMMLPIIIRSAEVVLRLVPGNLREASAAMGSSKWRTVWNVVLPTARPGLATAVILGMARGIGETSPVLLTAGYTTYLNTNPLHGPMVSLPLLTFELIRSGQTKYIARGLGAGAVLLMLVLGLFTVARVIGGHATGETSATKARRNQRRSARDAARIIASYQTRDAEAGLPTQSAA
jgi:phosphate transport system permease protein